MLKLVKNDSSKAAGTFVTERSFFYHSCLIKYVDINSCWKPEGGKSSRWKLKYIGKLPCTQKMILGNT